MKVITTDLLNRFWKNGVKPIMNAIAGKFDASKIVNNLMTTEEGFALDARQGAVIQNQLDGINSNLPITLTQEEYDSLSESDKNSGRWYGIIE